MREAYLKRIEELTGHTTNIDEALDQWEAERQALMEFYDDLQALKILNRRLAMAVIQAQRIIVSCKDNSGIFLKRSTLEHIDQWLDGYTALETARVIVRDIVEKDHKSIRKDGK